MLETPYMVGFIFIACCVALLAYNIATLPGTVAKDGGWKTVLLRIKQGVLQFPTLILVFGFIDVVYLSRPGNSSFLVYLFLFILATKVEQMSSAGGSAPRESAYNND